jgi:hypothetical protein
LLAPIAGADGAEGRDVKQCAARMLPGPEPLSPPGQGHGEADIAVTPQIRREINGQKTPSLNAQDVKIVTREGRVALLGPAHSTDARRLIGKIAARITRSDPADNPREIRSASDRN